MSFLILPDIEFQGCKDTKQYQKNKYTVNIFNQIQLPADSMPSLHPSAIFSMAYFLTGGHANGIRQLVKNAADHTGIQPE
jgi:hypothetical protein